MAPGDSNLTGSATAEIEESSSLNLAAVRERTRARKTRQNAQGVGFGMASDALSIGLASAVLVLGTLTGVRVHHASVDDATFHHGDEPDPCSVRGHRSWARSVRRRLLAIGLGSCARTRWAPRGTWSVTL